MDLDRCANKISDVNYIADVNSHLDKIHIGMPIGIQHAMTMWINFFVIRLREVIKMLIHICIHRGCNKWYRYCSFNAFKDSINKVTNLGFKCCSKFGFLNVFEFSVPIYYWIWLSIEVVNWYLSGCLHRYSLKVSA